MKEIINRTNPKAETPNILGSILVVIIEQDPIKKLTDTKHKISLLIIFSIDDKDSSETVKFILNLVFPSTAIFNISDI